MPEEHILSYDQCTSLVQEDLVSISSQFDLSGRITILFKWPLEMPRLNRDRINQYSFTTWSKEFAPGSISLQYNDYNLIPAVGLLKRGRCTSFDNINQNTHAQHNMSRSISAKGFAIRSEHKTPRLLATVEAFLLHIANHGFVSQVIFDMVLCFYALSINIRFLMQEEQFLCCYVTESWHSISFRSTVCVAFGIWPGANLRFTHTGIPIDEWKPHTWQETDIFDVEQVMLVEQETVHCHEETKTDVFRLNQIVSNFNETSGSNAMEYINMETCTDDRLIQHCRHVMQTECYSFKMSYSRLLNYDLFVLSKTIDLMNGVSVIMNIVNLFTEIRMAYYYIEMFKRNTNTNDDEVECVINNQTILGISMFLQNYPLFVSLRDRLKHEHSIRCVSSCVVEIVSKILRPLPLEPTHYVIHDTYSDFLMYLTQISRFIHDNNRLKKYDQMPFPMQIDFMIIPQCVFKYNDEQQYERVSFGIDSIGSALFESDIRYNQYQIDAIDEEYGSTFFYKRLCQEFESFQNKKRHQRYVIVIDRRAPLYDDRYSVKHRERSWQDQLYIFRPPRCNTVPKHCHLWPDGFIYRTQRYLLPGMGAKNALHPVGNGYMFCISYHLCQLDHINAYFYYNGYGQRFTRDELKYYIPRLFMKLDGKPQYEVNTTLNNQMLEMFHDNKDEQYIRFREQTMK
eukprot:931614_1